MIIQKNQRNPEPRETGLSCECWLSSDFTNLHQVLTVGSLKIKKLSVVTPPPQLPEVISLVSALFAFYTLKAPP